MWSGKGSASPANNTLFTIESNHTHCSRDYGSYFLYKTFRYDIATKEIVINKLFNHIYTYLRIKVTNKINQ